MGQAYMALLNYSYYFSSESESTEQCIDNDYYNPEEDNHDWDNDNENWPHPNPEGIILCLADWLLHRFIEEKF